MASKQKAMRQSKDLCITEGRNCHKKPMTFSRDNWNIVEGTQQQQQTIPDPWRGMQGLTCV